MNTPDILQDDHRGVSPVIGVILMVAITVILAAVIGSFVLGIGGSQEVAPQATINIGENTTGSSTNITVAHRGGEAFTDGNTANLTVSYNGENQDSIDLENGGFSTGDTEEISTSEGGELSGQVDVIWEGPQGTETIVATRNF